MEKAGNRSQIRQPGMAGSNEADEVFVLEDSIDKLKIEIKDLQKDISLFQMSFFFYNPPFLNKLIRLYMNENNCPLTDEILMSFKIFNYSFT